MWNARGRIVEGNASRRLTLGIQRSSFTVNGFQGLMGAKIVATSNQPASCDTMQPIGRIMWANPPRGLPLTSKLQETIFNFKDEIYLSHDIDTCLQQAPWMVLG